MSKKYNYSYTICNEPDEKLFLRQCKALEKHISGLTKKDLLKDVDGSLQQVYQHKKGIVVVSNDFYVGALYIDSDFDIEPYFEVA